jgi:hypothetical protein
MNKSILKAYLLCVVAFSALTLALNWFPAFGWLLWVVWPLVLYGWTFAPSALNMWMLAPLSTLAFFALLLSPVFVAGMTGRKAWLAAQPVLVLVLVLRFVTHAAQFFASAPR